MNCTMPKCRATINGMTGLQELQNLQRHFSKKHKIALMLDEAAIIRNDMEDGKEPNIINALLRTDTILPNKTINKS